MSDETMTRPLVDPARRRKLRLWIALGVLAAFAVLVVAHLI